MVDPKKQQYSKEKNLVMNGDSSKSDKIVQFYMSKINRIKKTSFLKNINLVDHFLVEKLLSSFNFRTILFF
jgi:hypothetical protein